MQIISPKTEIPYKKFKEIKLALIKEKSVIFAYIFGSSVGKGFNSKSDIDIAVYLNERKVKDSFSKRLKLMANLEKILRREADVVILNEITSVFFKFAIIKEGKLIFERNHRKRIEFEFNTMRDYFDFKPFFEKYSKVYLKRELAKL